MGVFVYDKDKEYLNGNEVDKLYDFVGMPLSKKSLNLLWANFSSEHFAQCLTFDEEMAAFFKEWLATGDTVF